MNYFNIKKLNIGSGRKKIEGFCNLDIQEWNGNTDIIQDLIDIPYPFNNDQIEEIICCEVLEHISFKMTMVVLYEFYRIMKKGGKLHIQVPDCGKMMEYYINNEICRCVNQKEEGNGFNAQRNCPDCKGKAKVNNTRWLYSFIGSQKYGESDIHKNIFTKESLEDNLRMARFHNFEYTEDINKIKVNCYK